VVTATAPFVARLARETGALTIAVMTKPFQFEGRGRIREADEGVRDIATVCDSTIIVPGDRTIDILGGHTPLRAILDCRDEAVCHAARAVVRAVAVPGRVCVGFADIHAVFLDRGVGAVGIGSSQGPHRAERAATSALSCPLLRDLDLSGAGGVFVQVAAGRPAPDEIERVGRTVSRAIGDNAAMIVGDAAEAHLGNGMRVTLVAAGATGRPPQHIGDLPLRRNHDDSCSRI
jgi:cell division protein FtsZ